MLEKWSQKEFNSTYANLSGENQAMLKVRIQKALRSNTYNSSTGVLTISDERAEAVKNNCNYFKGLFMDDAARESRFVRWRSTPRHYPWLRQSVVEVATLSWSPPDDVAG
jgi:nitric oxide reductase large subunit